MRNHPTYTFKQFNEEMNDFYKYLKENRFTDEEIRTILSPLDTDWKKLKIAMYTISSSVFLLAVLYFAAYIETVSWHFSAIGRIFLIKMLPFWDWTILKNEKCLISQYGITTNAEIAFNCDLCENIREIDVYSAISQDLLKTRYLDLDVPVIVKNRVQDWPNSTNFIWDLLANEEIAQSEPCNLATNIHNGLTTVKNLLSKTELFDNFFIHFQNCNFRTMKEFRSFTPRPPFLPPELSPVQYNWFLWNKDYNVSYFKRVNLVEKIAVIGQIVGSNAVKLLPRNNCEVDCPQIDVELHENEFLIFTSLWNLEYRPNFGENVAVILEMH